MQQTQQTSSIEIGLKKEIKRQVGFKNYEAKVGDYNKMCMIRAWKAMEAAGLDDAVSDMIWDYVNNPMGHCYQYLSSDLLGYKTQIKDYVSKKTGKVSLAHYTVYDSYLGSVAKMGPEPVSYEGYFRINSNDFWLELDVLAGLSDEVKTGNITVKISCDEMINKLFTPKTSKAVVKCSAKKPCKDYDNCSWCCQHVKPCACGCGLLGGSCIPDDSDSDSDSSDSDSDEDTPIGQLKSVKK